jgi:maleate isomerase
MSIIDGKVVSSEYQVVFDEGRHSKGKIGFVLLATEQTIVDDMMTLMPDGVGVHFARVNNADSITSESLLATASDLASAARSILPDGSLDVVTYACTSASLVIGEERVHQLLNEGAPAATASSIITAVTRALTAVAAQQIVVLTPYLDEVNTAELHYLERAGFGVLEFEGLNIEKDSDMVRVAPGYLRDLAIGLDHADADAIFISCGALRSIDVIEEIEQACGKPVVTSNQAMAWDALRLAGITETIEGYGMLLRDTEIRHPLSRLVVQHKE